jgi:hypothetical protein
MEGKSNKQIAILLGISEGTVEFHLTSIYHKLGVGSRVEAIIHLNQPGFSLDHVESADLGETTGEKVTKHGQTPVENTGEHVYDGDEQISLVQGREMISKKIRSTGNATLPILVGISFVLLAAIALYVYIAAPQPWKSYERECEHPDKSTGGQILGRSNASDDLVYGQFGVINIEPWSAMEGNVTYENISTPAAEQLYLKLRYSKNSSSSVPILVYLDGEATPRASVYPENQKDWNRFAWTDAIFLGSVQSGTHTITFATDGQQYGVADLDRFVLSAGPP